VVGAQKPCSPTYPTATVTAAPSVKRREVLALLHLQQERIRTADGACQCAVHRLLGTARGGAGPGGSNSSIFIFTLWWCLGPSFLAFGNTRGRKRPFSLWGGVEIQTPTPIKRRSGCTVFLELNRGIRRHPRLICIVLTFSNFLNLTVVWHVPAPQKLTEI